MITQYFDFVRPQNYKPIHFDPVQETVIFSLLKNYPQYFPYTFLITTEDSNVVEIDISSNQINKIPAVLIEFFHRFPFLNCLDLSCNQLIELPSQLSSLSQLKKIDLSMNYLSSLPKEINELIHLEEINLYRNDLVTFPTQIGNLKYLTDINLGQNYRFRDLPASFENLHLDYVSMDEVDFFHISDNSIEIMERMEIRDQKQIFFPNDWRSKFSEFHSIWDNPDKKSQYIKQLVLYIQDKRDIDILSTKFNAYLADYQELIPILEPLCKKTNTQNAQRIMLLINRYTNENYVKTNNFPILL